MFRKLRATLTDPQRQPLVYVAVMVWGVGLSINRLSNLVPTESGFDWLLIFGVPALIVALLLSEGIYRVFPRWQAGSEARLIDVRPAKQVVVLASPPPGIETAEAAVLTHHRLGQLDRVWILHSTLSKQAAEQLKLRLLAEEVLADDSIKLLGLTDAQFIDPETVKKTIEDNVFQALPPGTRPEDVIIDITGGKKETTAGAFLAGLRPGHRLQVTPPAEIDASGRGTKPGTPREILIDYKLTRASRR